MDTRQAKWATKWITNLNNYNSKQEYERFVNQVKNNNYTHLFEIISKEFPIILQYDYEGLVYHGSVERSKGTIRNFQ